MSSAPLPAALAQVKACLREATGIADFDDEHELIENGEVDSVSLVHLVLSLERSFQIAIDEAHLLEDGFSTPRAIASLCERIQVEVSQARRDDLETELDREIARAKRHGGIVSLLTIALRPRPPSEALAKISMAVQRVELRSLRLEDRVFPLEWDGNEVEVSILLPQTDAAGVEVVFKRIAPLIEEEMQRCKLSAEMSIGSASFPQDGDRAEELMRRASSR